MRTSEIPNNLLNAYERRQLVMVVGSGFTRATVSQKSAGSWIELIRTAADRLERDSSDFADHRRVIDQLLDLAVSQNDTSSLLVAASMIRTRFHEQGEQSFANFLQDELGHLDQKYEIDNKLGRCIKLLGTPLATTNYDTLLEHCVGTDNSATWTDQDATLNILRGDSAGVAHLHGIWSKPSTIVFSPEDYTRLTSNEAAVFGESSMFTARTFLFVGMGLGVVDPNFSHIVQYVRSKLGTSTHEHFLLCLDSEVSDYATLLRDTTIRPVSFGESYDQLPLYLDELRRTSGPGRQRTEQRALSIKFARDNLADSINANRLHKPNSSDGSNVLDTLVVPTFLPLPHEQYVHEKRKLKEAKESDDTDIFPIAPAQVLEGQAVTLVVGEEHGGITTALQWLALSYADLNAQAIPLLVDARTLKANDRLGTVILKEIKTLGINLKRGDELPDLVLAIDNVFYRESEKFKLFCRDLQTLKAKKIFLGCQLGNESEITRLLESNGATTQTVYLGKVGKQEIEKYAVIIAPNMSSHMVARALGLIQKEHLPRNPFTVSLILALLLQATSRPDRLQSQTDVLNEYMQLLLSHAGGNLDARDTLSVSNLERVLIVLAREFVSRRTGSLLASNCVEIVQVLFDQLDWIESPITWLEKLTTMRVLRSEGSQYSFRQSSYLYLYAAKAAVGDAAFMRELLAEPLFFAPVLKHCAALQRDNTELVLATESLLRHWSAYSHSGSVFAETSKIDAPELVDSNEDDAPEAQSTEEDDEQVQQEQEDAQAENPSSLYDTSNDTDIIPFPLEDLSETTSASKLFVAVSLASNVLRDSDAVAAKAAKDSALLTVLHSWGVLIDAIETDDAIKEGGRRIIEEGVTQGFYSHEMAEKVLEHVHRDYACHFVANGINESLRSKKLKPALDRLYSEGKLDSRGPFALTAAIFLELLGREASWSTHLTKMIPQLGSRWVATNFINISLRISYVLDDLTTSERANYVKILQGILEEKYSYKNSKQRRSHWSSLSKRLERVRTRIEALRATHRQQQLG